MRLYTITWDTDSGMGTSVHASQGSLLNEVDDIMRALYSGNEHTDVYDEANRIHAEREGCTQYEFACAIIEAHQGLGYYPDYIYVVENHEIETITTL